jgi:hypothetical protein
MTLDDRAAALRKVLAVRERGRRGELPFERLDAGEQLVEVAGHDGAHKVGERRCRTGVHGGGAWSEVIPTLRRDRL